MTSTPPGDVPPTGGWGRPPDTPGPPSGASGPGQVWQPPPGNRRNPLLVVGGILLGLGLGFFALPFLGLWMTGLASGTSDTLSGIGIAVGFALPILLGIALLVPRKLRKAGAGVLMGISIGMIVGSASCLGIWGLVISSYNGGA